VDIVKNQNTLLKAFGLGPERNEDQEDGPFGAPQIKCGLAETQDKKK